MAPWQNRNAVFAGRATEGQITGHEQQVQRADAADAKSEAQQGEIWQVRGKSMTQDMVQVEELVREIARALVDEPSAVEVESVDRDENTILKLRVAPQDVGKVIGKQGRTARSVRTILGAVSMKLHRRYTLDIVEEDEEK
jgi:hypothetical protein